MRDMAGKGVETCTNQYRRFCLFLERCCKRRSIDPIGMSEYLIPTEEALSHWILQRWYESASITCAIYRVRSEYRLHGNGKGRYRLVISC